DDPGDTVHEAFTAQLFGDTPLGRPVLGTVGSINGITRDQIWEHYAARYTAPHLVVAGAATRDQGAVVARVAPGCTDARAVPWGEAPAAPRLRKSDGVLWEGYGPSA